ncbi:MAG TPA: hypothetical protein RMH99_30815 [Sandaracinaceae bacterium LLY-WYZ-13_1]|nr:hypothetical protein [Sandaracinaceae bacterium LLY-WYZ-13_1]
MDEDETERLARRGLEAAELLEPGAVRDRVRGAVSEAAGDAALKGLAAVGRLTGRSPERSPARARAAKEVDLSPTFDAWAADDLARFEARVREAAARGPRPSVEDEPRRLDLAELRRSFPDESRELALLVFNCVDLLEELSGDAEGTPPAPEQLARKEQLLAGLAELLAPRAEEALTSFVGHVVATSRRYRSG